MTTTVTIGSGATIGVEPNAGAGTYTLLGEVVSLTPPPTELDAIDTTHMGSGDTREFDPGLINPGQAEVGYHFIPGSASDELVEAWVRAREKRSVQITYRNGKTLTFSAFPTNVEHEVPLDDKMMSVVTLQVSGAKTRA